MYGSDDSHDHASLSRREILLGGGAALLAGSLFSQAEAFAAAGAGSKKIGFALSTFTVPRYSNIDAPVFKKTVSSLGYRPIVNEANNSAVEQANNVDNLLAQDIGCLVILPVQDGPAVSMVRKAKRADVPVLAYNTAIPSGDVSGFVSRDNVGVGVSMANAAQRDTGFKGNWAVMSGDPGNAVATEWTKGVLQVINARVKAGKMNAPVGHDWINGWDTEFARRKAEAILTKTNNNVRGFLCNSDGIATGVAAAVQAQGLGGRVWISGQDASQPVCRLILEGVVNVASYTKYDKMARNAAQIAVKIAEGQKLHAASMYDTGKGKVPLFSIPTFNVTYDTLVEYLTFMKPFPKYVNAAEVFQGVPESKWPKGAAKLLRS